MTDQSALIQIRGVHKFFGDLHVLRGIDLDIANGEVCVIMGPSGSGKSTLLRCLNQRQSLQGKSSLMVSFWDTEKTPQRGYCMT